MKSDGIFVSWAVVMPDSEDCEGDSGLLCGSSGYLQTGTSLVWGEKLVPHT